MLRIVAIHYISIMDDSSKRKRDTVNWNDVNTYADDFPSGSSNSTVLASCQPPGYSSASTSTYDNLASPNYSWSVQPDYIIKKIVGHGSYGEVAEAVDCRRNTSDQKVAIKRMKNMFDSSQDATRAYREMHILR